MLLLLMRRLLEDAAPLFEEAVIGCCFCEEEEAVRECCYCV